MFTGIIEEIGVVTSISYKGRSAAVLISTKRPFNDLSVGDSISVDGVCLTVTNVGRNSFYADISSKTFEASTLSQLKIGQKINLERALLMGGRLGGHVLTGHVDGVIKLESKKIRDNACELLFSVSQELRRYIVNKGAVAINGVSLTVSSLHKEGFSVIIIPHTAKTTNLFQKQIGEKLNIEVDILAKYIENLLQIDSQTPTEKMFIDSGFLPIGIVDN